MGTRRLNRDIVGIYAHIYTYSHYNNAIEAKNNRKQLLLSVTVGLVDKAKVQLGKKFLSYSSLKMMCRFCLC